MGVEVPRVRQLSRKELCQINLLIRQPEIALGKAEGLSMGPIIEGSHLESKALIAIILHLKRAIQVRTVFTRPVVAYETITTTDTIKQG